MEATQPYLTKSGDERPLKRKAVERVWQSGENEHANVGAKGQRGSGARKKLGRRGR